MDEKAERTAFEEFICANAISQEYAMLALQRSEHSGVYSTTWVAASWEGWKGRAQMAAPAPRELTDVALLKLYHAAESAISSKTQSNRQYMIDFTRALLAAAAPSDVALIDEGNKQTAPSERQPLQIGNADVVHMERMAKGTGPVYLPTAAAYFIKVGDDIKPA